ncbi:MAG: type I-PGING CRISPR-associated protein Cas5p [Bacteroidota bacterium]
MTLDISILFDEPILDVEASLEVEALAPLSMVSTLPGSYYKCVDSPTKQQLAGALENVLGWHIGNKDRKEIRKRMKKHLKKNYRYELTDNPSAVGFAPLIDHLFEVDLTYVPRVVCRYDDYWTQFLKDTDERHIKGTPNIDSNLLRLKNGLKKDEKGNHLDPELQKFFKGNIDQFPMYYSSPTPREFIVLNLPYRLKLRMKSDLFYYLDTCLQYANIGYLGTSEGWIHMSISKS